MPPPPVLVTLVGCYDGWVFEPARGGMRAYLAGRLTIRRNVHLGVGFLAATSGLTDPGRLCFATVATLDSGHVPQAERPRETHAAVGAFRPARMAPRPTLGADRDRGRRQAACGRREVMR